MAPAAAGSGGLAVAAAAPCPQDPLASSPPVLPTVVLRLLEDPGINLEAEIARSAMESERGLMFRTGMAENHGMLFQLDRQVHNFWMHNTCISLDMLFLEDDGTIVGILENVPTLNDDPRSVGKPSRYVLETNGGWAKRHGLRPGQKFVLPTGSRG